MKGHPFGAGLVWLACASATAAPPANLVEWDASEPVDLEVSIGAGETAEVCSRLARSQRVEWSFRSSKSVDFNIHWHEDAKVSYAVRRYKMSSAEGSFDPPAPQTYCWMWSNERSPATLQVSLSVRR